MTDNLTGQQREALARIRSWYEGARDGFSGPFRLFGPAGTGKTTLARHIGEALGIRPVFGAYTGKAAHVLASKGCGPATTIHSAIYKPIGNAETKRLLAEARAELADMLAAGDGIYTPEDLDEVNERITELEKQAATIGFQLNYQSDWALADLIILDEVSMVNAKLAADVESFGVPVLVLGDPAQLPPVDGGGYYINATPDYELTEIHRQALDSPVLELATRVRLSTGAALGLTAADVVGTSLAAAMEADQILVWKNATRWSLTERIRDSLGRPKGQPVAGDRVMCLSNNKDLGVLNGTQFDVHSVEPGVLGPALEVSEVGSTQVRRIKSFGGGFLGQAQEAATKRGEVTYRGDRGLFTFANVITVHKAQGSEWDSVYVVDQTDGVMAMARRDKTPAEAIAQGRQWLYTAVTRAAERVTIAANSAR